MMKTYLRFKYVLVLIMLLMVWMPSAQTMVANAIATPSHEYFYDDDLEAEIYDLKAQARELLIISQRITEELEQKATEGEAPELYERLYNGLQMLEVLNLKISIVSSMDDVYDCQAMIREIGNFFMNLSEDITAFQTALIPDEAIDLGLPSGTKWAPWNVGASKPEDYGGYYAWGETEKKEVYMESTYIHYDHSTRTYHDIGTDITGTEYDVAYVKWGGSWTMPTLEQVEELVNNCTSEWATVNGINGRWFTGPNGNSIFLPAGGMYSDSGNNSEGSGGNYWSSTLAEGWNQRSHMLSFTSDGWNSTYVAATSCGLTVRPVINGEPSATDIAIDATNFPDENFRNWILVQDYGQDGVLTQEEIAGITEIYVDGKTIQSLQGIEFFTALTYLNCSDNQLTSLDMSNNTALTWLVCHSNQLTSLDVSHNAALDDLCCFQNQLTSLNVSNNIALTYLDCCLNLLASLDVSNNTTLGHLNCYSNNLTALDVSNNTALGYLSCSYNQLTSFDVSNNTALEHLGCYSNNLTALDVSHNKALRWLYCNENQLTSLDVSNITALELLNCSYNQLTSLDVSNNTALVTLFCESNQLTSLDVSHNTALTRFNCSDNQLSSLDVSYNTALTELNCSNNQLTSLDVSHNTALTMLDCATNQLTSLDVSHNMALGALTCHTNQLTSLDVSNNTALTSLECCRNYIDAQAMDALVSSLPTVGAGGFYVLRPSESGEGNECTPAQVASAIAKGWKAYQFDESLWAWVEMEGEESTEVIPDKAIDLGLPSGTKWAPWNVGASKPEEYGGYYSWGETEVKDVYSWETYIHCDGTYSTCHDIGTDIAGTNYDVAHDKWGGSWKMPTWGQLEELWDNCSMEWTTVNGINGRKFTGPNGNSIFLPAAGGNGGSFDVGSWGLFWSSSSRNEDGAHGFGFNSEGVSRYVGYRVEGLSVRPVICESSEKQTFTVNGVSFNMVKVNGGTFMMGATTEQEDGADSDEYPVHQVTLSDYYIGETEVTQELWTAVMGNNPSYFTGSAQLPVEQVSWNDCQKFITKLNSLTGQHFSLPTEAEWEFAARGGNASRGYTYSGSNDLDEVGWYIYNSSGHPHDVATKSPNELGLFDMSGNVCEWCQDWYGPFSNEAQTNPLVSSGSERVARSGDYGGFARSCRIGDRYYGDPSSFGRNSGLRLAFSSSIELPVPTDGLVAYYPLNGNANDESGNGYHGTPCNSYQFGNGIVGGCITVEGQGYTESSGGHVLLPQFDFDASSGVTLSLWVKAMSMTASDGEVYISLGDHTAQGKLFILQEPSISSVSFQYHDSRVDVPYLEEYTGKWVMYTLTCEADGKLKAYVNGTIAGEEDVDYDGQISTSWSALGRHWWNYGSDTSTRFSGSFDEVRIYNRALSQNEIQVLYSEGAQGGVGPDVLGDVNGDGKVTPADAIMILYYYFNVAQMGFSKEAADLNGDGAVTPADAIEALYLYFGASGGNARAHCPKEEGGQEPE